MADPQTTEKAKNLGTMTAKELSDLERRIQLEDPATIQMPGGGTYKDVLDQRAKNQTQEMEERRRQAARDVETEHIIRQSPELPDSKVLLTTEGHIVSSPMPLKPKEPAAELKTASTSGESTAKPAS